MSVETVPPIRVTAPARTGARRAGVLLALALLAGPLAGPAYAQSPGPSQSRPDTGGPAPNAGGKSDKSDKAAEAPRPRLPKDKRTQLEGLFAALKVAPDERSSKQIADRLEAIFADSGSPSCDILMARALAAADAKQYDLALELLDQVILIEPDYIGAISKRATLRYMKDDYAGALADLREVIAREPRHYASMYGLALIFRDLGDDTRALDAVRRARAVNPRIDGSEDLEDQLTVKVEGRQI
ncbi:tetratricopeptide repeat protein [Xanthobacter pseudotagetidis]|uniref:tetratricopeptide repeat protein n=1 Tax=Xanthobacter pseudotagetidis TaxID=3119911 RepID=UPI00372AF19A